ncbi:MAG: glutamine synthetase [archaeon]
MDKLEIIERARKGKVRSVRFMFSDISGTIRNVTIPHERLKDSLENGIWSSGNTIEGLTRTCDGDMYLYLL